MADKDFYEFLEYQEMLVMMNKKIIQKISDEISSRSKQRKSRS